MRDPSACADLPALRDPHRGPRRRAGWRHLLLRALRPERGRERASRPRVKSEIARPTPVSLDWACHRLLTHGAQDEGLGLALTGDRAAARPPDPRRTFLRRINVQPAARLEALGAAEGARGTRAVGRAAGRHGAALASAD